MLQFSWVVFQGLWSRWTAGWMSQCNYIVSYPNLNSSPSWQICLIYSFFLQYIYLMVDTLSFQGADFKFPWDWLSFSLSQHWHIFHIENTSSWHCPSMLAFSFQYVRHPSIQVPPSSWSFGSIDLKISYSVNMRWNWTL